MLRVTPDRKYQRDGGPGIASCARVIREWSALPAEDLPRLVQWVAFNCLIGNEDAHAKNLAFLYGEQGLRLAPYYDLVTTLAYPDLERSLAMKVGTTWDIRNVQRSDWRRLAAATDLGWDPVRAIVHEMLSAVTTRIDEVVELCSRRYDNPDAFVRIADVIKRQAQRVGY